MKKELIVIVEVRDKNGNLYKNNEDSPITKLFQTTLEDYGEELTHIACEHIVKNLETVCKEGSKINLSVVYKDSISGNFSTLYSYYGAEKKFIKH